MSTINYSEKIPNNVNLSGDRALQRALEHWQPNYLQWWQDMGPEASQNMDVYLRTAVSVQPDGWAHFDYVKMPDYPSPPRTVNARSTLAKTWAAMCGRKPPVNTAPTCVASS